MSAPTHKVVNGETVPLTPEEIAAIEAEWAANTPQPARRLRSLVAIRADLSALSSQQQSAIWTDMTSGSPPKILTSTGPSADGIDILQGIAMELGLTGQSLNNARRRAVAMYVRDNPGYLVNPSFDATINVPGDELDPAG